MSGEEELVPIDFSADVEGVEEDPTTLRRVRRLAEILVEQKALVERMTAELKEEARALREMEEDRLPGLMAEIGLAELTLSDGAKIQVKPDCTTSITAANHGRAIRWLVGNDYGGIVKTQVLVEFDRGDVAAADKFSEVVREAGQEPQVKQTVHASTLKAFVKERLAASDPIPLDVFSVRQFDKAHVSIPKTPTKGKK